jgi:hypothetical protein
MYEWSVEIGSLISPPSKVFILYVFWYLCYIVIWHGLEVRTYISELSIFTWYLYFISGDTCKNVLLFAKLYEKGNQIKCKSVLHQFATIKSPIDAVKFSNTILLSPKYHDAIKIVWWYENIWLLQTIWLLSSYFVCHIIDKMT